MKKIREIPPETSTTRLFLLLSVVFALTGCKISESDLQSTIAVAYEQTSAANPTVTLAPTNTQNPTSTTAHTYTLYPTETKLPTYTVYPTFAMAPSYTQNYVQTPIINANTLSRLQPIVDLRHSQPTLACPR